MFEVKVLSEFAAAHYLRGYKGKCENMHGHNYKLEVIVSAKKLNSLGLAIDFVDIKKELSIVTEQLDHKLLDELSFFKKSNPSAENIAKHIYTRLKLTLNKNGVKLKSVLVWETDRSCATYSE
ncbi:MAG: 6-carboxytetrahydropterin synthase QueD [Candidatus Firestonebacteria bacterium]